MSANVNPSGEGYPAGSIMVSVLLHFRRAIVLLLILMATILLIAWASGRPFMGVIIVALHLLTALLVWIYCVILMRREFL